MTQFGMYSTTTPRNDASPARGQWNLDSAYRYISEAYGGYHFDRMHGINVDAGIFMSYVGLFSYYQFDNWAYQPSYVSSNTPWFFNGVRIQIFPERQAEDRALDHQRLAVVRQVQRAPGRRGPDPVAAERRLSVLGNNYLGKDTLGNPGPQAHSHRRQHPGEVLRQAGKRSSTRPRSPLTVDAGCEYGGGVSCHGGSAARPAQYFLGFMAYNRFWFHKDMFGLTLGGGAIDNPGRYLVLLPPINGATAFSGTPYFTENPGDQYRAWDYSVTFDCMPKDFVTFRLEFNRRASDVPYFSGPGGITPPGGNTGPAGSVVSGFTPDLTKTESRITGALLVKY